LKKSSKTGKAATDEQSNLEKSIGRSNRYQIRPKFNDLLIMTKPLPLPSGTVISENELKEFFSPTELRGMLPPGATFIEARPTQIEGLPAGILEYSMRQERAGKTVDSKAIAYMFISGTNLVQLQCMVSTGMLSTPTALARRMDEFRQVFFLMANSIVLQNRYK
jgi:hypothetical protein